MRNMVARYIDRKGSPKMMIDMSLPEEVFKEVLDSIRPEENLEGTFIGTNIDAEHLKNNMDILLQKYKCKLDSSVCRTDYLATIMTMSLRNRPVAYTIYVEGEDTKRISKVATVYFNHWAVDELIKIIEKMKSLNNINRVKLSTSLEYLPIYNNTTIMLKMIIERLNEVYDDSVELTFGLIDEWTGEEYK